MFATALLLLLGMGVAIAFRYNHPRRAKLIGFATGAVFAGLVLLITVGRLFRN